jgi:phosphopantothenate synthetase
VASRRLKEHNVPILRFNGRVHAVLLSEIMRLEQKLTQKPGINYFHGRRPTALEPGTLPPQHQQ